MFVTITIPDGVNYIGTYQWYVDPADDWTVGDLARDVCHAIGVQGWRAMRGRSPLDANERAAEALRDGDRIDIRP